ncbi:MAG: exosortase-associated EpsI family protein [bacterium]|nr:exosortase-associated EpsI family protein [bacterium]
MVPSKKLLIVAAILVASLVPRFLLTGVRHVSAEFPGSLLPERVGRWQAKEVLICSTCLEELKQAVWQRESPKHPDARMLYLSEEVSDSECPVHGTPLTPTLEVPVDFITRKVLPPGTKFLRKWYRGAEAAKDLPDVNATVITSGSDRRSIHRPERCLQGQGWQIVSRDRWAVARSPSGPRDFRVTRLVVRRVWLTPEGDRAERKEVVFYWFMGHNRLTGSNLKRLTYAAWDRMAHRLNYPWSYTLLIAPVRDSVNKTTGALSQFVPELMVSRRTPAAPQKPADQSASCGRQPPMQEAFRRRVHTP